jgi:hypothetical protein
MQRYNVAIGGAVLLEQFVIDKFVISFDDAFGRNLTTSTKAEERDLKNLGK